MAVFNVRTVYRIGQQVSRQTLLFLKIDVCCVFKHFSYSPQLFKGEPSYLTVQSISPRGSFCDGCRLYDVGFAINPRAECALLDWIPVNSRLCAVRLAGSIKVNANRHGKRCLFVVSAYAPTDGSSEQEKDERTFQTNPPHKAIEYHYPC